MKLSSLASLSPDALFTAVADEDNLRFTRGVLERLQSDPQWTPLIIRQIEAGCIEIRSLLSWLARELNPATYLEVGVRRGFSMAMVAARRPDVTIYGFDLWIPRYAGVENPGPRFVRSEIRRLGHRGSLHLVSGDSRRTLPAFFGLNRASPLQRLRFGLRFRHRPPSFDLITVDGDHSLFGAHQDLIDTMPFCSVGGVVVFDDIVPDPATSTPEALQMERGPDPHGWGDLLGVWHAVQREFTNFRYFEYVRGHPGVGLAVRMR